MQFSSLSALGQRTAEPPISWLMKMTLDRPQLISLAAGFTDSTSLPVQETRRLVEELLSSSRVGRRVLQYGTTPGLPALRELTVRRLAKLDGVPPERAAAGGYSPDRVLITHGSQQLLYILTEALCDPGDIVLVEDPTYFVYLGIMQSHGVEARGIPIGHDGLDVERLEAVLGDLQRAGELPRVKLLYMVSYFQNPTGRTTSLSTKQRVLEVLRRFEGAAGHPIYLLEDAAYRELRFAADDVPSALSAEGAQDRVIYAGTYSKPFATGIRVGFGLLPEPILQVALRIKGNHDFGTANFMQELLAAALQSGVYDAHVATLQRRYRRKARTMTAAMRAHFPAEVQWDPPAGGLYVWARLAPKIRTGMHSELFKRALEHDVLYVPGGLCYADDPTRSKPDHEMRLSYGHASEPAIREGIARLGQALKERL